MNKLTIASILAGALALLTVPGAFADRSYADPAGDSGTAPDMTAVRVSHDAGGTLTFAVTTNQAVLDPAASIYVYVDSDRDPATGFPIRGLGADHFFGHSGELGTGFLFSVSGNFIIIDFTSTLTSSYAGGVLTAQINRSDLSDVEQFTFLVEAERDDENDATPNDADFAPDAAPLYEYSLFPLTLTVGSPRANPARPVAGKPFAVSAAVARSDAQAFLTGKVSCKARVGTASLRSAGTVSGGAARCAMRLPKTAKGKTLRGTLTVSTDDAPPVTRSFSYRVR